MRLTGQVWVAEEELPLTHTAHSHHQGRNHLHSHTHTPGGRGGASRRGGGFAFVKQEDLFYSQLTVREVLLFTARLRLSKRMNDAEKRAYVEQMIFKMGLTEVADTLVGDEKKRGISGGERKRLSLACELMGNPSRVVFADEPTRYGDVCVCVSVCVLVRRVGVGCL